MPAPPSLYPRHAEPRLSAALDDTPVVLVHGPRQCGKTTLAREVGEGRKFAYLTFDDPATLAAGVADPVGFVDELPPRVVLDEVQRAPALFAPLKAAIDRRRVPGRFILTGSANVLTVPRLSDSLAGRMEIIRLHPLSQAELARGPARFLDRLLAGDLAGPPRPRLRGELAERIAAGGFPPALARARGGRRAAWYRDYVETLVQRDVRDLSRIGALDALPRLLAAVAAQTARLVNVTELAAPFELSRPTVSEYVTLLERVFLVDTLPPWSSNRLSRLVKTPKLHVTDTGVACAVLGLAPDDLAADRNLLGPLLETFVLQDLRRQASGREDALTFSHLRDRDGVEVDVVIERGVRDVAGVEVKAGATVTEADFRGLRKLRDATGARFRAGVVLHDGENTLPFGDRLHAVPIRRLWEP
jgi:predicted AAA+ superfamily ATPase